MKMLAKGPVRKLRLQFPAVPVKSIAIEQAQTVQRVRSHASDTCSQEWREFWPHLASPKVESTHGPTAEATNALQNSDWEQE